MSIRSLKIPGRMLGLGTFVNSDVDAKRKIIYFDEFAFTAAANENRTFTQGQTKMATIEAVFLGRFWADDKGSGSCHFTVGTLSNGTVILRGRDFVSGATNVRAIGMSFWMVGSPDPQRIVL